MMFDTAAEQGGTPATSLAPRTYEAITIECLEGTCDYCCGPETD